jgi:hypothetical protein
VLFILVFRPAGKKYVRPVFLNGSLSEKGVSRIPDAVNPLVSFAGLPSIFVVCNLINFVSAYY